MRVSLWRETSPGDRAFFPLAQATAPTSGAPSRPGLVLRPQKRPAREPNWRGLEVAVSLSQKPPQVVYRRLQGCLWTLLSLGFQWKLSPPARRKEWGRNSPQ